MRRAVLLLSGGLDSTTVLAQAVAEGYAVYALTFVYGQRQAIEARAAQDAAARYGAADWRRVDVDLGWMGGSSLTGAGEVPKGRDLGASGAASAATTPPSTYVPGRNTILLAHALGWAEVVGAMDLFVGVSAVDYSGYPDCRPAYVQAFEALANHAVAACAAGEARFRVHAPLQHLSKADTVRLGMRLGVDYAATHSCYDPVGEAACGACDACVLRRRGFAEAGVADPTRYVAERRFGAHGGDAPSG